FRLRFWFAALALGGSSLLAQNAVTLDNSESVFAVLTAINNCGYDAELAASDPLRLTIRREVGSKIENSIEAKSAAQSLCSFYREDRKSTRLNSSHGSISYAVFCLKK